jgi:hypothetical protein
LVESSNLHGFWERRKREGGEVLHGLKLLGWWNDRGERRRGVKDGFLLLWPHGLKSGVTGQTGDGHRLVTAQGRAREPLSVFPTHPR